MAASLVGQLALAVKGDLDRLRADLHSQAPRIGDEVGTTLGARINARLSAANIGTAVGATLGGLGVGGRRVGQYGEPTDVPTPLLAVQAKVGASFSERYWRWLQAIPQTGDRIPVLIVGDALVLGIAAAPSSSSSSVTSATSTGRTGCEAETGSGLRRQSDSGSEWQRR